MCCDCKTPQVNLLHNTYYYTYTIRINRSSTYCRTKSNKTIEITNTRTANIITVRMMLFRIHATDKYAGDHYKV